MQIHGLPIFQCGGLFIKAFFETLQFSFGPPKLLSMSMLREKEEDFIFNMADLCRNKGKSFTSERKYLSLHVLFQGLINVTQGNCIFVHFFVHSDHKNIIVHKYDIYCTLRNNYINLNFSYLARNKEK